MSEVHASLSDNPPDWDEDGNSPLDASGAQSHTYNLTGEYDMVLVVIENFQNTSGGNQRLKARLNGDNGANYDFVTASGNVYTDSTQFGLLDASLADGNHVNGQLVINGRWSKSCGFGFTGGGTDGIRTVLDTGVNKDITSPLDSITFYGSNGNVSVTAHVYGVTT